MWGGRWAHSRAASCSKRNFLGLRRESTPRVCLPWSFMPAASFRNKYWFTLYVVKRKWRCVYLFSKQNRSSNNSFGGWNVTCKKARGKNISCTELFIIYTWGIMDQYTVLHFSAISAECVPSVLAATAIRDTCCSSAVRSFILWLSNEYVNASCWLKNLLRYNINSIRTCIK